LKPRLYPWLQFTKWVYSDILIISKVTALSNNFAPLNEEPLIKGGFSFSKLIKTFSKQIKKGTAEAVPYFHFWFLNANFCRFFAN
jgi:hypothetical protein